jgi:sortase A
VGQLQNGVNPGDESGNVVFSAHNDIWGELFRYLDQLEAGDQFQVQTQTQIFTYQITGWEVVEPTAVHVLESTGDPTATLISCYPYQIDNKRIVVFANRVDSV